MGHATCAQVAALLVYVLCTLFSDAFVFNFIAVVLLLVIDFWTVRGGSPLGAATMHPHKRLARRTLQAREEGQVGGRWRGR